MRLRPLILAFFALGISTPAQTPAADLSDRIDQIVAAAMREQ